MSQEHSLGGPFPYPISRCHYIGGNAVFAVNINFNGYDKMIDCRNWGAYVTVVQIDKSTTFSRNCKGYAHCSYDLCQQFKENEESHTVYLNHMDSIPFCKYCGSAMTVIPCNAEIKYLKHHGSNAIVVQHNGTHTLTKHTLQTDFEKERDLFKAKFSNL